MSRRRRFPPKTAMKLAGVLAADGVSRVLHGPVVEATADADPAAEAPGRRAGNADGHSKRVDLITYGVGYVLALALTCAAFGLVYWRWATGTQALAVVFALALVQALVHFRCFLHVDLKRSARDDLQLILFSTVIVCLMVGGTLVVLFNLRLRMM